MLLLDGATGTELDRRGVDVSLPLWSARACLEAPEVLESIHRDYLEAGAGALTANTFRTTPRTLAKAGIGDQAAELTRLSVEIARRVCVSVNPRALVLGSVATLEDCYRPDLAPNEATCRREHETHITALVESGVDYLLIETMNNLAETRAAIAAARSLHPGRWLVSFCLRSEGPPGVLLSGESLEGLLADLDDAWAVGVNCVAAPTVEAQVVLLAGCPSVARVAAYANIGHADEAGNWVITDAVEPKRYAEYALRWRAAGASVIGGCCGTRPATIRAVAEALEAR
ncbi:MAG: homocysteine S-methyltransferase family protein [Planctomycetota bacterium]